MALRPSPLRLSCLFALGLAVLAPAPGWTADGGAAVAQAATQAQGLDAAQLSAWVEQVRGRFEVPGIAVAVVKDGEVVFEGGWGVRELGMPARVDQHTQFAIASNTKAFTAAALAVLVDEGRLAWDDKVTTHLPWFRMSDPYVTANMQVRDLLTHRSGLGLGAGDLLFWPGSTYDAADVVRRLQHVPLKTGFRERYAYDNILYATASVLVEQVSGQAFADFLQARFFTPLGMHATRANADALRADDQPATGHAKADFTTLRPTFALTWHNASGAGGVYSSVHDMSRWMGAQLAAGRYTDAQGRQQQLFSPGRQKEMWSLQSPVEISEPAVPELAAAKPDFLGYGLGWFLSTYRGHKLVWHTGGWPGQVSRVTLVPDLGLGVVVLTNQESGAAFNAITMHVLDAYLAPPQRTDWVAAYDAAAQRSKQRAGQAWEKRVHARDARARPSLPLSGYAGTYRDRWYGDVEIILEDGRLGMRFGASPLLAGRLQHWQHDTFLVKWDERTLNGDAFVTFSLDPDGAVREARMEAASDLTDFSFDFQDLVLTPVE